MNNKNKKIGIAADHAGYELKELIVGYLDALGYDVHDFGTHSEEAVDYPDVAHPLGYAIDSGQLERGISVCGSGNGINMTLNKHPAVRAALCWSEEITALARSHNDANACSLPARFIDNELAVRIIERFLNTPFEGGRHLARIEKIPLPAPGEKEKG